MYMSYSSVPYFPFYPLPSMGAHKGAACGWLTSLPLHVHSLTPRRGPGKCLVNTRHVRRQTEQAALCPAVLYLPMLNYHMQFIVLLYILFSPNCYRSCQPDHNLFLLLALYEKCYDLFQKLKEVSEPREKKLEEKTTGFQVLNNGFSFPLMLKTV